jgi:hypothetical protein
MTLRAADPVSRDAWYLRRAGDGPGSAKRLLQAQRRLAARDPLDMAVRRVLPVKSSFVSIAEQVTNGSPPTGLHHRYVRVFLRQGPGVPDGLNHARGLGRQATAVMIVGAMIAREPAFELRVAILASHRIDLLHV